MKSRTLKLAIVTILSLSLPALANGTRLKVLDENFPTGVGIGAHVLTGYTDRSESCQVIVCTAPGYGAYSVNGVLGRYIQVSPDCSGWSTPPSAYEAVGIRLDSARIETQISENTSGAAVVHQNASTPAMSTTVEIKKSESEMSFVFTDWGRNKSFSCIIK